MKIWSCIYHCFSCIFSLAVFSFLRRDADIHEIKSCNASFFRVYLHHVLLIEVIPGLQGIEKMKVGRYLIVFVLLMGALITFGDRGLIDNFRMKEKMMALKKINHEMTLENIALKKNISLLRDDLSYVEMMARSELGMVKKGDLVYRTAQ